MPNVALITGGCGFVGRRLAERLLAESLFTKVVLYDVQRPRGILAAGQQYVRGSVQNQQQLQSCLQQYEVGVVFHIAAYGMTGAASLDKTTTWEVNVLGTRSVIAACIAAGVPRLVYTSTCNVVFGGQPIPCGDEGLPYYPPHKQIDYYSSSKTIAETAVLAANGTPLSSAAEQAAANNTNDTSTIVTVDSTAVQDVQLAQEGQQQQSRLLRTCALRPNGIFGAGEMQHSMRVVGLAQQGLLVATIGPPDAVQDWTHIDNLVQAQVLAAGALTEAKGFIAAGQAYFITDPKPTNSSAFMNPLLEGLGYKIPGWRIPYWLVYAVAWLSEWLYRVLPKRVGFVPMFTRSEMRKACVTHHFNCAKAIRELGYQPVQHTAAVYLPWFLEHGFGNVENGDSRQR